jgi:hypothetical protein
MLRFDATDRTRFLGVAHVGRAFTRCGVVRATAAVVDTPTAAKVAQTTIAAPAAIARTRGLSLTVPPWAIVLVRAA